MGTGLVTAPSAAPQWAPSVTRPAGPQRTGHCGYTGPVHKDSQRPAPDLTKAPRSATVSASEHRREQVRLLGDTPAPRNTASYRLPLASHGVHGDFSAPPTAAHRQAGYTRPHAHICTCARTHTPTHVYMHAHVHTPPARAPTHAHTHARPQTPTHTHYLHTCTRAPTRTRPAHTHTPHTPPASTRTPVHTHARTHTRTSTRPGEPRGKVGPGGRRGPEPRPPLVSRAGTCRGSQSGSLWSWHLSARACHRPASPHGPVSAASPNAHRSGFLTSGAPHGRGREDTGPAAPPLAGRNRSVTRAGTRQAAGLRGPHVTARGQGTNPALSAEAPETGRGRGSHLHGYAGRLVASGGGWQGARPRLLGPRLCLAWRPVHRDPAGRQERVGVVLCTQSCL